MLTPRCEWRDISTGLQMLASRRCPQWPRSGESWQAQVCEDARSTVPLPPVLPRLSATLAGPEHLGLRVAFAEWLRRSWAEEYGVLADLDDKSRRELDRMVAEGEVEAMGSLAVERWREQKAQIHARGRTQGRMEGRMEGRTEGIEHYRHSLARQAARRFGASAGERLSALLAGISEPEQLAAVGDAIIDCKTGAELLTAARRIAGVN